MFAHCTIVPWNNENFFYYYCLSPAPLQCTLYCTHQALTLFQSHERSVDSSLAAARVNVEVCICSKVIGTIRYYTSDVVDL
jgi:hypothetical protein